MKLSFFCLFIILSFCAFTQDSSFEDTQILLENNRYTEIDSHARNCPNAIKKDPEALVSYFELLTKGIQAIFIYEDDKNTQTFTKDDSENRYFLEFITKEEVRIDIVIESESGELFSFLEYSTK